MTTQLFNHWVYVGGTTAEQKIAAMLQVLHTFGRVGNEVTAYELGRLTGVSPQHCNRILKKMYGEGVVDCTVFKRGSVEGRRWFAK